jgi:hypothetical protein
MNCASADLNHPAGEADQKRGSVTEAILRRGHCSQLGAVGCRLLVAHDHRRLWYCQNAAKNPPKLCSAESPVNNTDIVFVFLLI